MDNMLGKTVYIIATCNDIRARCKTNGYCVCENNCPHKARNCKKHADEPAAFEDVVIGVGKRNGKTAYYPKNIACFTEEDVGNTVFENEKVANNMLSIIKENKGSAVNA